MITLHTLASGSSGNALTIACGHGRILVDAGISCRRISRALQELEASPGALDAILITHAHSDHIAGLQTLLKRTTCPVFSSKGVISELTRRFPDFSGRFEEIPTCSPQTVGPFRATAFPTSHDAPGACGFRLDGEGAGVGILTDTGFVTPEAERVLPGVSLAVLEANHDVETLQNGPYPYYLQQRILGPAGHLCNEDAARFAVTLARSGARQLILAHLSRENNTPDMALDAVEAALAGAGLYPDLSVAPRETLSGAYIIAGESYAEDPASLCGKTEGTVLRGRRGGVRQTAEQVL